MKENIFRKESLEKIESPDELDKYVKVTNPKIWILLLAIIVLLVGGCIWGFFGRLNTVVKGACISIDGKQECVVNESDAGKIQIGNTVKIANAFGVITNIDMLPAQYFDVAKKHNYTVMPGQQNGEVREFEAKTDVPDGTYFMEVIVESKAPFAFVFNY